MHHSTYRCYLRIIRHSKIALSHFFSLFLLRLLTHSLSRFPFICGSVGLLLFSPFIRLLSCQALRNICDGIWIKACDVQVKMCDRVWGCARACCDCIFASECDCICLWVCENSVGTIQYRIAWHNMVMRLCEYGCVCTPTWRSVCGRVYSAKKHIVSVSTEALEWYKHEMNAFKIVCVLFACFFLLPFLE